MRGEVLCYKFGVCLWGKVLFQKPRMHGNALSSILAYFKIRNMWPACNDLNFSVLFCHQRFVCSSPYRDRIPIVVSIQKVSIRNHICRTRFSWPRLPSSLSCQFSEIFDFVMTNKSQVPKLQYITSASLWRALQKHEWTEENAKRWLLLYHPL